jgi:hypothetical protein
MVEEKRKDKQGFGKKRQGFDKYMPTLALIPKKKFGGMKNKHHLCSRFRIVNLVDKKIFHNFAADFKR